MITNSTKYYINSRQRISGTDSDFTYQIQIPPDTKYNKCCVLQISIPKSYYLIQIGEYFVLEEGKIQVQIQITPGNYTRKSLAATVQQALNAASPNGWAYVVTYPNSSTAVDTGKYTFTVTGNGGVQPTFIFSTDNDIFQHLGFDDGSTNNFVANSLTSINVINIQRETTLYLHSDMANNGNDNVLQEVFASGSADFSSIVFQQREFEAYSKDITTNQNNIYRFYLTDEDGRGIDLNGQNINFCVILYYKNDIYDMIKHFLKLQIIKK